MTEQASEQYVLYNAAEEVIMDTVRSLMKDAQMCKCEKCFKDVCAITLNKTQPHYVTSKSGALFTKIPDSLAEQHASRVVVILRAIEIVAKDPKHS